MVDHIMQLGRYTRGEDGCACVLCSWRFLNVGNDLPTARSLLTTQLVLGAGQDAHHVALLRIGAARRKASQGWRLQPHFFAWKHRTVAIQTTAKTSRSISQCSAPDTANAENLI